MLLFKSYPALRYDLRITSIRIQSNIISAKLYGRVETYFFFGKTANMNYSLLQFHLHFFLHSMRLNVKPIRKLGYRMNGDGGGP